MRWVFLLLSALLFLPSRSQENFNLIYIQLEYEMDYALVNQKLDNLISNELDKQNFILLYANAQPVSVLSNTIEQPIDLGYLHQLISNNQTYHIQMVDVKSAFLKILDNQAVCMQQNTFPPSLTKNAQYNSVNIYCMVGRDFFNNGYQNDILGVILFAGNLHQVANINLHYYDTYPIGDVDGPSLYELSQFNELYSDNTINIHLK